MYSASTLRRRNALQLGRHEPPLSSRPVLYVLGLELVRPGGAVGAVKGERLAYSEPKGEAQRRAAAHADGVNRF